MTREEHSGLSKIRNLNGIAIGTHTQNEILKDMKELTRTDDISVGG
jgi:hypothetical protein